MRETILEKKETPFIDTAFDLTEIINGEEYTAPGPFSNHQIILARLYNLFYQFIYKTKICEIFSPLDVVFEEGVNRPQPDVIKKEIYERYGVKDFWLVFPEGKAIQVYRNNNGRYRLFSHAEQKGTVRSQILDGLEIKIEEVFGE